MHLFFIVLFGWCFSDAFGQYYFVTAPNVLRFNYDESVVVNVFKLHNVNVKVWLQLGNKAISQKTVIVPNEESPQFTTVRLSEKDITDFIQQNKDEEKPTSIDICSEYGGTQDCQTILISYETGYIIVQTDQPVYTPRTKVLMRALVFDESLKPINNETVTMYLVSPSNRTLGRQPVRSKGAGFYLFHFDLPPHPEVGLWTARASLKGQYNTQGRASFTVQEYVLPTFGVTIEVNQPYVLPETQSITITVKAKYVYGKPVEGNARLQLNLLNDMEEINLKTTNKLQLIATDNQYSVAEFNINVADILAENNGEFPKDQRLQIIATVLESATGNEEVEDHSSTLFTEEPFRFKFSRSKLIFRPGMEYFLKFQMLYATGHPVPNEEVEIMLYYDNQQQHKEARLKATDSEGRLLEVFPTFSSTQKLRFVIRTTDGKWKSDEFTVDPYKGNNQIQVEMVTKDGEQLMRANTNAQGDALYTGMLFMVVTRGTVVYTKFKSSANQNSDQVTEALMKAISPNGRLIVFYVDTNTNEIVADSVKFDVPNVCRGKELVLSPDNNNFVLKPGELSNLNIDGDANMLVGLNVMDKALLLLNEDNVLRRKTMFDKLASHDLGCGEGSGSNSAEVFKKTGLTVLTNAKVSKQDLKRGEFECAAKHRKKRSASVDDCYGVNPRCCDKGEEYAHDILYYADEDKKIDAYAECLEKAKEIATNGTVTIYCLEALFRTCRETLQNQASDKVSARSFGDDTDYTTDFEKFTDAHGILKTRTDFRESWLWNLEYLDGNGHRKVRLNYPQSITEWMVQAIGISNEGVCIAKPLNMTTFRNFFIQLELPYKAIRLEHIEVKATIFNYGLNPIEGSVFLKGSGGLCFGEKEEDQSKRVKMNIAANSAQTFRFPMVGLKTGKFEVTVTAMAYTNGVPESDAVQKDLYVVNEGIEMQQSIKVCLDPLKQSKDCINNNDRISQVFNHDEDGTAQQMLTVDLTLPNGAIPDTGSGTGYLMGNAMDNVVQIILDSGIEGLFQKPAGCGEQTMIRLAPTVSAMNYLKQTKQVTAEIEKTGNDLIREGVHRELTMYRKPDGSYAAWTTYPTSTWLTAFVAKIFCQAKSIVDDVIDNEDIKPTINWLLTHGEDDGSYIDYKPVIHKEMIGQIPGNSNQNPSLSAFVLVALHECEIGEIKDGMSPIIRKTTGYIESLLNNKEWLKDNPYVLALSAYAMALTKSNKRHQFKILLDSVKNNDKDGSYWGQHAGGQAASANAVETTSYALLAMLEFNDIRTSEDIVRWLTSQREAKGTFRTTQDTVVGLQALSEYSIRTYSRDLDLKVELLSTIWREPLQLPLTNENAVYQKVVPNLPVEHQDNKLTITVKGTGTGTFNIDLRHNRPAKKNEICGFNVSAITVDDVKNIDRNLADIGKCDICGYCEEMDVPPPNYDDVAFGEGLIEAAPRIMGNIGRRKRAVRGKRFTQDLKCVKFSISAAYKDSGMTLVSFGLETGVEPVKDDLDKLIADSDNIDSYEYDNKGFVVFYMGGTTAKKTDFIFRVKDTFDDEAGQKSRQPAVLTVYDYYNPDRTCTKTYRSIGESFSYTCDDAKAPQCKCQQNVCIQSIENELLRLAEQRKIPALKLQQYTCNSEKANYAVFVQITHIGYDPDSLQNIVNAVVKRVILKGIENLEEESEMTFFYPLTCQKMFNVDDKVYIIGLDGNKYTDKHGAHEYRYPLMGSTLIIKKPNKKQYMYGQIMKKYKNLMATGCQN